MVCTDALPCVLLCVQPAPHPFDKHEPLLYKNKNATSWVAFSRDVICLPFNDHSLAHRFPIDRKLY